MLQSILMKKGFAININVDMHMHWKNLVGITGLYEGADESSLVFKFDNILWQAVEDDMDGYRSMLDYVVYADDALQKKFICNKNLAKVVLEHIDNTEEGGTFSGYVLKDIEDGHVWLEIGTNYMDEWYPCVIFNHCPKLP